MVGFTLYLLQVYVTNWALGVERAPLAKDSWFAACSRPDGAYGARIFPRHKFISAQLCNTTVHCSCSHTRRDVIKHFELAVSIMRSIGKAYDCLPHHLISTKLPNNIIHFFKYVSTSFSTHNFPRSPGLIRCPTIE